MKSTKQSILHKTKDWIAAVPAGASQ